MNAEPQREHAWLSALAGDWTYETEWSMGPDKPKEKSHGKETARKLGDLWIVCEARGTQPFGGESHTLMTLGYDPMKKKFVGTFVGAMMTELWVYEGTLDEAGKVLSLHAKGPSMKGDGSMANYVDSIEIVSDRERVFRGRMEGEDGQWIEFMKGTYRREG